MSLDRLFAGGGRPMGAQRVFTDRQSEQSAFDAAVLFHWGQLENMRGGGWDIQDLDRPRRNVLVFYGIGGIGKSSLLDALARRTTAAPTDPMHWPRPPAAAAHFSPVTVDVRSGNIPSLETLLLRLRASLGGNGQRFPAFDLLLANYWAHNHPEVDLHQFLQRQGRFARLDEAIGVSSSVEDVVADVAQALLDVSSVGSSVTRMLRAVVAHVRDRRLEGHALAACHLLEELLMAPPTQDTLAYASHALAWDYANVQQMQDSACVVLLDTFEEATPEFEEQIQKVAWLMPNVLFVIGSRRRIRWGDADGGGPTFRKGPDDWPLLAAGAETDPRQHLVGSLADEDSREYLVRSLGAQAEPAVVDAIVSMSKGIPLHLDLAVQRWAQVSATRQPTVEDLSVTFGELARRIVRDLDPEERRALLAACLFDCFDHELVRATADLPIAGPVMTLTRHPLVAARPDLPLPFALHDGLREVLVNAQDLGPAEWAADDWRHAGQRAIGELRRRIDVGSGDPRFLAQQAFRIARTFSVEDLWLVDVAGEITKHARWQAGWSAAPLPVAATSDSTGWPAVLADGLAVVMSRHARPRSVTVSRLVELLDSRPSDPVLDVLRYFLAEALRDVGRLAESAALLHDLRDGGGAFRHRAVHATVHLLRRAGQFKEIQELLVEEEGALPAPERLWADLWWTQARFADSLTAYRDAFRRALANDDWGEAATCAASAAFVLGMSRPTEVAAASLDAERAMREHHSFARLMLELGRAMAAPPQEQDSAISAVRAGAAYAEHSSIIAYADLSAVIAAVRRNDEHGAQAAEDRLIAQVSGDAFKYLVDISRSVRGLPEHYGSTWLDEGVPERWRATAHRVEDPLG